MQIINDEYFMRQALNEAQQAFEKDEVPIGAVIVMNNKIIARAHNQVELLNDATAHAEILALTSAFSFLGTKYLPEAVLYVTVEPCLMCCGALYWSKIGSIVYGADDEKNGYRRFIFSDNEQNRRTVFHPKTQITKGVLANDCAFLMKLFFKNKR
jgi:tRNA(adenine34) deaminase